MDKFKEKFKQYIIKLSSKWFLSNGKRVFWDPSYIDSLIRLRFAFKYNKMIAGQGWDDL